MQQVIYVDVLIFLNSVISLILLLATAEITGVKPGALRLTVGALLGGAYSLVILAPEMDFYGIAVTRLAMALSLVCIVFKFSRIKTFLRCFAAFFGSSIMLAGLIWVGDSMFSPSFISVNNGFFYFGMGATSLIAVSAAAFAVLKLVRKNLVNKKQADNCYKVDLSYKGNVVSVFALCDTGNGVNDVYSGADVIIVTKKEALRLIGRLSDGAKNSNAVATEGFDLDSFDFTSHNSPKVRLLPVYSLQNESLLPCFTVEKAVVYNDTVTKTITKPTVAVTSDELGGEKYSALINEACLCK